MEQRKLTEDSDRQTCVTAISTCYKSRDKITAMQYDDDINQPGIQKWRSYKNVIMVALGFTLLFSSFNAIADIQSSINKFLGITALWVVYGTVILSSLFIPTLLTSRLELKWTMPMCMLAYSVYIAAQYHPRYYTLVPTSFLVGLASAPLWSSQSSYLTELSIIHASSHNQKKDIIIPRMFGLFFSIFQLSKILGGYTLSTVLSRDKSTQNTTELNVEQSETCGANFCPADLQNLTAFKSADNKDQNEGKLIFLISILLCFSLLSVVLMAIAVDPISRFRGKQPFQKSRNVKYLLLSTYRHLTTKKQLLLIPITFWPGFQRAFISADFTAAFITCSYGIHLIGYVMLCFGLSQSISSLVISGYLVQFTGRIPLFSTIAIINLAILIFLLIWQPHPTTTWPLLVIALLWGICYAVWQSQLYALYGTLFSEEPMAAFSNFNLCNSFGFLVAYLISGWFCIIVKLYILIAILTISMIGYCMLEIVSAEG